MKKIILVVIAVLAITAASYMFIKTFFASGMPDVGYTNQEKVLMRCFAPGCENIFETGARDYYSFLQANARPGNENPPFKCPKCGKNTASKVIRCPNCSVTYVEGSIPNDYPDRCPKCRLSQMEKGAK